MSSSAIVNIFQMEKFSNLPSLSMIVIAADEGFTTTPVVLEFSSTPKVSLNSKTESSLILMKMVLIKLLLSNESVPLFDS